MSVLRIAVTGITGRLGSRVAALAAEDPELELAGGIVRELPHQPYEPSLRLALKASELMGEADVLVDFTRPEATLEYLSDAAGAGKSAVVGTTGFDSADFKSIERYAEKIPIVLESNFSLGIAALKTALTAGFQNCGEAFECRILETHRRGKKDAPSGTAKDLAETLMPVLGEKPEIVSYRLGEIPGEHLITLTHQHEQIEITHRVYSRDVFALGALRAAKWVAGQKPGLYRFTDVLGKK